MASQYIQQNYEPSDRLAVLLLNHGESNGTLQHIANAARIGADNYQAWLERLNGCGYDIYISMNTLQDEARRRTKEDIREIRHLFLDFDEDGTAAVERLLAREDLPEPNYLLCSSPGRWQVIWRVARCDLQSAESIQRALVRSTGADQSVIDIARVMRLPGYYNRKYATPHLVTVEQRSRVVHPPEVFPRAAEEWSHTLNRGTVTSGGSSRITPSERDWAYVRSQLRRGVDPQELISALAESRSDKFNPADYAKRTVNKALTSLMRESAEAGSSAPQKDSSELDDRDR